MSKYSEMTTAIVDYSAGTNTYDVLKSMWDLHCEGVSEVQTKMNGARVIIIDERLFQALGKVSYK